MKAAARAALLLGAVGCSAAPAPRAVPTVVAEDRYVTLRGSDTLATEEVVRAGATVRSVLQRRAERLHLEIRFARGAGERVDSLALHARFIGTDAALQRASVRIDDDSARLVIVQGQSAPRPLHVGTRPGALPFINLAVSTYEQLVRRARTLGLAPGRSVSIPVFLPEGARTVEATVRQPAADSVVLVLGAELRMSVAPDGRVLGVAVPTQGVCVVRPPAACVSAPRAEASYEAPADAPYVAHEVTIEGSGGTRLGGTLTVPRVPAGTRVPAVLLLTGSGAQDRDEAIGALPGYRPFRQLADTLSRRGLAVLRLDDRGVGASDLGREPATIDVLARDAARAVAWLRSRPDVRTDRIAIVGHSEGGVVGPAVAARDSALRALVLLAAQSRTGRAVSDFQVRRATEQRMPGASPAAVDSAVRRAIAERDSLAPALPSAAAFLAMDPAPLLRAVRAPVLVVHGETDRQVTADQAAEVAALLRAGGNVDVTVRVIPRTNHLLLEDPNGDAGGYASLPSKIVRPEIVGLVADWLVTRLR